MSPQLRASRLTGTLCASAVLLMASAAAAPAWAGQCNWILNGNDPGRGLLDAKAHKDFALDPENEKAVSMYIGDRLFTLVDCLDRPAYAKTYADASVLIAAAGRKYGGWKDGQDAKAPVGDSGRGVSNLQAHIGYGLGPNGPTANTLVQARMAALYAVMPREAWADLYAALSMLFARVGNAAPVPPSPVGKAGT